jgi:hypothetical protein
MGPFRQASDGSGGSARRSVALAENNPTRLAFIGCVDRLESLIEKETEALKANAVIDFEDFNQRKTHALLEFSRVSRAFGAPASRAIEVRLERLQSRLAENSVLLETRLRAMKEIADIMIRTIEKAESDGTYSTRYLADR